MTTENELTDKAFRLSDGLDGIINIDTDSSMDIGFTSDKYGGYLWKDGDSVIVSFIVSKKRGNFRELVQRIHALGMAVKVPTPLGRMQEIVVKNGYKHTNFYDENMGECMDLWVLQPNVKLRGAPVTGD
ncbi:MAG: hypothetical protein ABL933_06410 [Methyloglobulus sp.]|nr:hypothetical protein [Methyloglobulus sp.]